MIIRRIRYYLRHCLVQAQGQRPRSKIVDTAWSLGKPIFTHVIKLSLYGELDRSWRRDIINWLQKINSLTFNGKRLSADVYYEELFDQFPHTEAWYREFLDEVIGDIRWNGDIKYDIDELHRRYVEFYRGVSEELTGVVHPPHIHQLIDRLIEPLK